MKLYSIDLRTRILEDCDAGVSTRVVATKYRVSDSCVRRLKQRRRETGEIAPRERAPNKHPSRWHIRINSGNWSTNNRTPRSTNCEHGSAKTSASKLCRGRCERSS